MQISFSSGHVREIQEYELIRSIERFLRFIPMLRLGFWRVQAISIKMGLREDL